MRATGLSPRSPAPLPARGGSAAVDPSRAGRGTDRLPNDFGRDRFVGAPAVLRAREQIRLRPHPSVVLSECSQQRAGKHTPTPRHAWRVSLPCVPALRIRSSRRLWTVNAHCSLAPTIPRSPISRVWLQRTSTSWFSSSSPRKSFVAGSLLVRTPPTYRSPPLNSRRAGGCSSGLLAIKDYVACLNHEQDPPATLEAAV